jgi:hypothetical protein
MTLGMAADYNILMGYKVFENADETCPQNVVIGYNACKSVQKNANVRYNVIIGHYAGSSLCQVGTAPVPPGPLPPEYNVILGYKSGYKLQQARHCVVIGEEAMAGPDIENASRPYYTVALGYRAFGSGAFVNSENGVAIGKNAAIGVVDADNIVAIGARTLENCTYGKKNIAIGFFAGSRITDGCSNIAIGVNSECGESTSCSIAIGSNNDEALSETAWVTVHAYVRGDIVMNTNADYICLVPHTSGTWEIDLATGNWKMTHLQWTTGTQYIINDLVYYDERVYRCTDDHVSTVFDPADSYWDRKFTIAYGMRSIAIGCGAVGWGDQTIAIGRDANAHELSGIAIGRGAQSYGVKSIAIGDGAMADYGDRSIAIGAGAYVYNSQECRIGATNAFSKFYIGCSALTTDSDRRLKTDIVDIDPAVASAFIQSSRPRFFKLSKFPEQGIKAGFVSQEVMDIQPPGAQFATESGGEYFLEYQNYIAMLVSVIQGLTTRVEMLEKCLLNK